MSYRRPESYGTEIPVDNPIPDPQIYMGLAIFSLFLGIGLAVAGCKGRQWWLIPWGTMLAIVSVAYGVAIYLGYG